MYDPVSSKNSCSLIRFPFCRDNRYISDQQKMVDTTARTIIVSIIGLIFTAAFVALSVYCAKHHPEVLTKFAPRMFVFSSFLMGIAVVVQIKYAREHFATLKSTSKHGSYDGIHD